MNSEMTTASLPIYDDELKTHLVKKLTEGNIDAVEKMFACHHDEAMAAIKEYDPSKHEIMSRSDKKRKNKDDYRTNKLPRNWQQYINEISVFFMFNNDIKIQMENPKDEQEELKPYLNVFKRHLKKSYFNERMRDAKRIAGSETECAKLYELYVSGGTLKYRIKMISNSMEHKLYTLFNRHEDLIAFGDMYHARNLDDEVVKHFDIYTDDLIWHCEEPSSREGWTVEKESNFIGKIPVIYYRQQKEWAGVEERIKRDEWLDSKAADTCEYCNDPYLKCSSDLLDGRLADAEEVGKLVKVSSKDSVFEFVNPPEAGELMQNEKKTLKASILEGTFTPDLSYESIMGLGTLSGEAIQKMSMPGFIKRGTRLGVYRELINREFNLVKAILSKVIYLNDQKMANGIDRLDLSFTLQDPFDGNINNNAEEVQMRLQAGGMSIRTAVEMNPNVIDKDEEMQRILEEKRQIAEIESQKTKVEVQTEEVE